jgi:hypothetical protein
VNVNCPQADLRIGRPDRTLELISGMHPVRILHEVLQQAELLQAAGNGLSVPLGAIGRRIQVDISKAQTNGIRRLLAS